MTMTASQRPTREWPWLVLALALVGVICIPLWQFASRQRAQQTQPSAQVLAAQALALPVPNAPLMPSAVVALGVVREPSLGQGPRSDAWSKWTPERFSRLLLGPEQILSYAAFTWAGFLLLSRWLEVRRQYRAFRLNLLDTEEGVCILPEDARLLQRRIEQSTGRRPYILANMIRLALGKYAVSRSGREVSETIRTQADVDLGRLVSSMATVHYLAWAIPAIGFLGTVRGLATSLTMGSQTGQALRTFIADATTHLNVAFDCTLIALALSLVLMFLVHSVQRDEEALVLDCQQYCLEHLLGRLYDLEPQATDAGRQAPAAGDLLSPPDSPWRAAVP